jgi:2-polyprenyl-3-methyl-5-hydroxy-6-metoxy-1,4-benzoquinol methylase
MIGRAAFDRAYAAEILNRRFVEDIGYYHASRQRFWQAFRRIEALGLPAGARTLDIGGGIMAVLTRRLLGHAAIVGDVNERAQADVAALGLDFVLVDLFRDAPPPVQDLDLVILQEVIEHIPQPPYVVLARIAAMLKPGGRLFLTTPNGHRFRNLLYLATGREILGIYRYPEAGEALGHQHEYTRRQLLWQAGRAGFEVAAAEYYADGWQGSSRRAQLAWTLARPVDLVPYWRNGIAMTLRRPG